MALQLKNCLLYAFVCVALVAHSLAQTSSIAESEKSVNAMIHHCWMIAYSYDAMAAHFGRPEVGQKFIEEFLHHSADRHLTRARELEEHLNMIGGTVKYMDVKVDKNVKTTALEVKDAIEQALTIETSARDMLKSLIEKEAESETGHFFGKFLHHDTHAIAFLRTLKARLDIVKTADLFYFAKMMKHVPKTAHPNHFGEQQDGHESHDE